MGILKSNTDLRNLKEAARIAGDVCDALIAMARPGVPTTTLEAEANRLLALKRSTAPFKQFQDETSGQKFGHAICVSLNDEIVNGPPARERLLKAGDVVSIAIGSEYRGIHGKAARTAYVVSALDTADGAGKSSDEKPSDERPPKEIERLIIGTQASLKNAVEKFATVNTLNELLKVIPETAAANHLAVIENGGGCGIGKRLHEDPMTPNRPEELGEEILLTPGLAFTLMPMFSLGHSGRWRLHQDGWTQVTADGAMSAHFADTFLVTEAGLVNLSGA